MRNYKENPLKFGEEIPYEDLYEIYINQNTSMKETWEFFGISKTVLRRNLKLYNLHKSTEQAKELRNKTNLEKYGVINPFMDKERVKKGVQEKYGVDNVAHLDSVLEKRKDTCLERYGGTTPFNSPEIRKRIDKNNIKKFGGNSPQCSPEVREKSKGTCQQKYGVNNISQLRETKEKVKRSFIKKYGVENISQKEEIKLKKYLKKKENNTLNSSKEEELILEKLKEKYKVIPQYRSEKYPFACDFYLPELDLYIEYQGFFSHGKEPFNPQNKEHQKILNNWIEKSQDIKSSNKRREFYKNAILTWTISDPIKRLYALENNINWIEFFSFKDFMKWFNNF